MEKSTCPSLSTAVASPVQSPEYPYSASLSKNESKLTCPCPKGADALSCPRAQSTRTPVQTASSSPRETRTSLCHTQSPHPRMPRRQAQITLILSQSIYYKQANLYNQLNFLQPALNINRPSPQTFL